jgi:uncharacterized phage protein (TIGR02218 family)
MPFISSLFSAAEKSGGAPAECFQFQRGSSLWRYTSARETQTISGVDYLPAFVKRAAVQQKNDTPGIQITVSVALEAAVAQALLIDTAEPMRVTIQRVQTAGDPVFPLFLGEVIATKFSGDAVELTVATVEHQFKRLVPSRCVQRTCVWDVYGAQCGVDPADFAHATTISSVSGQVITVGSVPAATMVNGMIRLPSGRMLFVPAQSTTALTIWDPIPAEAIATASVTLYPGCDKTLTTCEGTFANGKHFGGFPNLPIRNPSTSTLN